MTASNRHLTCQQIFRKNEMKVNTLYWIMIPFCENDYEAQNAFVLSEMLSSYVIHQNLYLVWIARDKVVVFNTYKESLVSSNAKHFWGLLDFLQFQTDYAAFHVVYLPCTHFIICCMLVIVLRNFRLKCLDDEKGLIMERMRREKMLTSWINKGNTFIIITICKICVFSIMRIFNYAYFQLCALVLSVFLIHKKHI